MSKDNKSPLEKKSIQNKTTNRNQNHYLPIEIDEKPTENRNSRTDSPKRKAKVLVKQNAINTKLRI